MRVNIQLINDWMVNDKVLAAIKTEQLPNGLCHAVYEDLIKLLQLSLDNNRDVTINSHNYTSIRELIIKEGIRDGEISLAQTQESDVGTNNTKLHDIRPDRDARESNKE